MSRLPRFTARKIFIGSLCALFVSAVYLYIFPTATIFYAIVVLLHALLGAGVAIALVGVFWKRFRGWTGRREDRLDIVRLGRRNRINPSLHGNSAVTMEFALRAHYFERGRVRISGRSVDRRPKGRCSCEVPRKLCTKRNLPVRDSRDCSIWISRA